MERTPKIFSDLSIISGKDYLTVQRKDAEITRVIAAYGRVLFMVDSNNKVVGVAIANASRGMDRETYWRPQYSGWEVRRRK